MEATIKDNKLTITIDVENPPKPSTSGKTLLVATTSGFKVTDAEFKGQKVAVSLNATVKA